MRLLRDNGRGRGGKGLLLKTITIIASLFCQLFPHVCFLNDKLPEVDLVQINASKEITDRCRFIVGEKRVRVRILNNGAQLLFFFSFFRNNVIYMYTIGDNFPRRSSHVQMFVIVFSFSYALRSRSFTISFHVFLDRPADIELFITVALSISGCRKLMRNYFQSTPSLNTAI